jgi:hypothetical protein
MQSRDAMNWPKKTEGVNQLVVESHHVLRHGAIIDVVFSNTSMDAFEV